MRNKFGKGFFISEIITSELAVLNRLYQEENICHWQSMCRETILRICLSQRQIFANSVAFAVINKYGKGSAAIISTVFGPTYDVAFRRVL